MDSKVQILVTLRRFWYFDTFSHSRSEELAPPVRCYPPQNGRPRGAHHESRMFPIALALAAKDPRHAEFEAQAVPHMEVLYNYALRTTGNSDDANDLLQETYLKAYRFWDKFEQGTNLRAWLFRIMKNTYINQYRKDAKEPDTVDYDEVEGYYNIIRDDSSDDNDLQRKMFGQLLDDDVTKALETLPEEFRTAVILSDIEGMTYEEIAEFLQIPVGTVRSRLHRGRKLLYTQLYHYAKERGFIGRGGTEAASPTETAS